MSKMTETELQAAVKIQLVKALGYNTDILGKFREQALNSYFGKPQGTVVIGCSAVVSTDVADMVEAVVAGILPAFETDNVITFEAMSADDEKAAQLESDAVNYFVMEENPGYIYLQEALRDALLLRNGFMKVWVEEIKDSQTQSYKNLNDVEYFQLIQKPDDKTDVTVVRADKAKDGDGIDCTIKTVRTDRNLKIASVDPTNFYYSQHHDSIFLDDIQFCGERIFYTKSDLLKMGFDRVKVMALPVAVVDTQSDTVARNQAGENNQPPSAAEPSQELCEVYECYYRIDVDGDGIAELHKIIMCGTIILSDEEWEFVPYSTGTGILQPHRINGLGLWDKLHMVEEIKTGTLRQYLDNFINCNNNRVAYRKGSTDTDALLNPRPGGAVGCDDPGSDVVPIPAMDIGASAQALLNYMDTVRSSRGGASLDLQTASAQIAGETAQGIERQYSVREMLAAMMCRTLAETLIASTYRNVHRALRLYRAGSFVFRRRVGFEKTDPSKWPERNKVNVLGGLSYGERNKKIGALGAVIQQQQQLFSAGMNGVMVSMPGYYAALIDMQKASGLDHPEKYFVDPSSQESQAAAKQMQQQQQQTQQQQTMMQQQMFQSQQQLQQALLAFEKYKVDTETRFKYYDAHLGAEVDSAKIVAEVAGKAEVASVQALAKKQPGEKQQAADTTSEEGKTDG